MRPVLRKCARKAGNKEYTKTSAAKTNSLFYKDDDSKSKASKNYPQLHVP